MDKTEKFAVLAQLKLSEAELEEYLSLRRRFDNVENTGKIKTALPVVYADKGKKWKFCLIWIWLVWKMFGESLSETVCGRRRMKKADVVTDFDLHCYLQRGRWQCFFYC